MSSEPNSSTWLWLWIQPASFRMRQSTFPGSQQSGTLSTLSSCLTGPRCLDPCRHVSLKHSIFFFYLKWNMYLAFEHYSLKSTCSGWGRWMSLLVLMFIPHQNINRCAVNLLYCCVLSWNSAVMLVSCRRTSRDRLRICTTTTRTRRASQKSQKTPHHSKERSLLPIPRGWYHLIVRTESFPSLSSTDLHVYTFTNSQPCPGEPMQTRCENLHCWLWHHPL